jgi:hypothetical protein
MLCLRKKIPLAPFFKVGNKSIQSKICYFFNSTLGNKYAG